MPCPAPLTDKAPGNILHADTSPSGRLPGPGNCAKPAHIGEIPSILSRTGANMNLSAELEQTVRDMVQPGKGILAADESAPTIKKRFAAVSVESTEENRRSYRSLAQRSDDGTALPELLASRGIVPGIKVDKGLAPLANAPGDRVTQGLDGLAERLQQYKSQGARFAKWREVYAITDHNPTALGLEANAEMLARYAAAGRLCTDCRAGSAD